eukprot:15366293-Ditylum_brightwellii.AAC.1
MINCWEEKGVSLLVSTPKMISPFFILKRSFGNVSTLGSFGLLHIATVEEGVDQMDTNDEAILFGEGGAISSKTSSAHKSSPS